MPIIAKDAASFADYALGQPDPYQSPAAVNIGGQPSIGTGRPVHVAHETVRRTPSGDASRVPARESDDEATLAAWYFGGAASTYEHYRSVTLAECKEIIRARYAVSKQRISEDRIKDLAHTHENYLEYLRVHLEGRIKWHTIYKTSAGLQ